MTTPARVQERKLNIEGYADQLSVKAGDQIGFHISTSAEKYSIEIARVGAERELVWTKEGLPGVQHPVPENASTHGCNWPVALRLPVPRGWKSGLLQCHPSGHRPEGP